MPTVSQVTQLQGLLVMVPNPISFRGSFRTSFFHHFSGKATQTYSKFLRGNVGRLNPAYYGNVATCQALDEFSMEDKRRSSASMSRGEGIDFLGLMEQREIRANYQTYIWLLEGSINSGSLIDATMLHGTIMKSGFGEEFDIYSGLVDVYAASGDLHEAVKALDDMQV